jgi:hypothetical protein
MKNYATLFVLFFSVMIISAQKKTFNDIVQYRTGNTNGKDLTIEFAAVYFTYMNDPQYNERAKIISEGAFIMYNGKKYFKSDIGQEVFDKVKMGLVNIQFDIYQGSSRVSTVRRNNVSTSAGLVQYGYFWRTLWPGVSAENAKNIFKNGFTVKNVKIYNVKFNIYPLKDLLAKRKREAEAKAKEEERLRVEAEKKKIEEERLRVEAQQKEEERLRLEAEAKKKEEERLKQLELENKKNESLEKRFEEEKKEASRQAEIEAKERKEELRLKKEAIDRNLEIEQKRIDKESADNAAVRRRMAERRKEEEARKKRKQAADLKRASKMGANAITGTISALSDWDESFIGVRMSSRTLFSGVTEDSFSPTTYEFTMGEGGGGFFIGYGSPEKGEDSFGTMIGGFEKQLFNVKNIFKVGLILEGGKGDLNEETIDSKDLREDQIDQVWFYGGGIYIKLLKYVYFSYTVGNSHFNKETSTHIKGPQTQYEWVETIDALKYTELYSGLRFGINIPL